MPVHSGKNPRWTRAPYWVPAAAIAALVAGAWLLRSLDRPPRPNIILISNDTLRADRLGCYGCPDGTSPNFDAFSLESAQFMWAISQAPSTVASHMSLFSGLLPPVHRVTNWLLRDDQARKHGLSQLNTNIPTLALYLKESGYRTIGLHSGGNVSAFFGFDRGFDLYADTIINWESFLGNRSAYKKLLAQMRPGRGAAKPFFLFIHHYLCHDPYIRAPRKIRERFLSDPVPGLPVECEGPSPREGRRSLIKARESFWKPIDGKNPSHRRHVRALYNAGVNTADAIFGEIIGMLKREGLYDQALITVLSDHGEEFWEHGGTLHRKLFVETLHVPLMIKFPGGVHGARRIHNPIGLYDLMPTILDYLRIRPRGQLQARSLMPLIRGEGDPPRRVLSFDDGLQFVRFIQGSFSYSNHSRRGVPGDWLYNRITDPREARNRAAVDKVRLAHMRSLAAMIMKEQKSLRTRINPSASGPAAISRRQKTQLEALGYL